MTILEELKKRVDEHFKNEAKLLDDITAATLTLQEKRELLEFMRNHPWAKNKQEMMREYPEATKQFLGELTEKTDQGFRVESETRRINNRMKSVKLSDKEYEKLLEAQKYLEEKHSLELSLGGTVGLIATNYLRLDKEKGQFYALEQWVHAGCYQDR